MRVSVRVVLACLGAATICVAVKCRENFPGGAHNVPSVPRRSGEAPPPPPPINCPFSPYIFSAPASQRVELNIVQRLYVLSNPTCYMLLRYCPAIVPLPGCRPLGRKARGIRRGPERNQGARSHEVGDAARAQERREAGAGAAGTHINCTCFSLSVSVMYKFRISPRLGRIRL